MDVLPTDTSNYKYDFSFIIDGIKNPGVSSTVSGFSDYFYAPPTVKLEEEVTSTQGVTINPGSFSGIKAYLTRQFVKHLLHLA